MNATHLIAPLAALAAVVLTLPFRPWAMLRRPALRHPWLAALVLLPWLWSTAARLPGGLPVQLSLACLTVLMFGWPLAVWTWLLVAAAAAGIAPRAAEGAAPWLEQASALMLWNGLLPGTLALLVGLATRRWLPHHLMVYILARGFGATLVGMALTGALWVVVEPPPAGADAGTLFLGRWLMAWGDAVATGMLVSIFVAYRPEWLATYSDERYLPPR